MATIQHGGGSAYDTLRYSHSQIAQEDLMTVPLQVKSRTMHELAPEDPMTVPLRAESRTIHVAPSGIPHLRVSWANVNALSSSGTGAPEVYRQLHAPASLWHADALVALGEVDDEIAEENLPEINDATKTEARRIVTALARHPWAPTVYPTQDAEIAIHFKSRDLPNSVVILLNNGGQAECYAHTSGKSRRAHYDVSSDIPDGFVMEQLRALTRRQSATWAASGAIDPFAMIYHPGLPTMW